TAIDADDSVISVTNNTNGFTVDDGDGLVYSFRSDGKLQGATSATDDRASAAPVNGYSSDGKLTSITDPVSGRVITLRYGGDAACPAPVAGFDTAAPTGFLCRIAYWDSTTTDLLYLNKGLARIVDPG